MNTKTKNTLLALVAVVGIAGGSWLGWDYITQVNPEADSQSEIEEDFVPRRGGMDNPISEPIQSDYVEDWTIDIEQTELDNIREQDGYWTLADPAQPGFVLASSPLMKTFNAVGGSVTVKQDSLDGMEFSVRFKSDDGAEWSEWYLIEPDIDLGSEPGEIDGTYTYFLSMFFRENSKYVQLKIDMLTDSEQVPGLHGIDMDFIFPVENSSQQTSFDKDPLSALFSTSEAAVLPKEIVPRSEWATGCPLDWGPERFQVEKIVVHHTVGGDSVNSLSSGKAYVNSVCQYHSVTRGWGDIGYNYLIDPVGNIYEGRYGGPGVEGAHAYGLNKKTVGIAMIGTYSSKNITTAARNSLKNLLATLSQRYGINLAASSDFEMGCQNFTDLSNVIGHRDGFTYKYDGLCNPGAAMSQTQCPGDYFYPRLPSSVAAAAELKPTIPKIGKFYSEFFASSVFDGAVVKQAVSGSDGQLTFNWETGSPDGVPSDKFSAKFWGKIDVPKTGLYKFTAGSDDKVRLYIDNIKVLNDWDRHEYRTRSVEVPLSEGIHSVRVEYVEVTGDARLTLRWTPVAIPANKFIGSYYTNALFRGGARLVRLDDTIDFNWGADSPHYSIPDDYFTARWEGRIDVPHEALYALNLTVDDRARLFVDNELILNAWIDQPKTTYNLKRTLSQGSHQIRIDYREKIGKAVLRFNWGVASASTFKGSKDVTVKENGGNILMTVSSGQEISVAYDNVSHKYYVFSGGTIEETSNYIILDPGGGYTTITSYEGTHKDYAGDIVVRASEITEKVNIINRIKLEPYLKGLWGETGLNSDPEYTKALIIAARTYAVYHYNNGGKHPDDYFDLNNTASDQVYWGYNPDSGSLIVQAVLATRGFVVTHPDSDYKDNIAVTSYFSQSDGTTRNSEDVWGGYWPWARSVNDPWWYDTGGSCTKSSEGRVMRGHGVGLSGRGAYCYATMDSKKYDWLLNHYYTDIDIREDYPTSDIVLNIGIYSLNFDGSWVSLHPDGTLVKVDGIDDIYLVENGLKRLFTTQYIFDSYGYELEDIVEISAQEMVVYPEGPPMPYSKKGLEDGTLIMEFGGDIIYKIEDGLKRAYPSFDAFKLDGRFLKDVIILPLYKMNRYPTWGRMPETFVPRSERSVLQGSSPDIYLITNGKRLRFVSTSAFLSRGFKWSQIEKVTDIHLGQYPVGKNLEYIFEPRPDGTLLRAKYGDEIYLIENGRKHLFTEFGVFQANGYKESQIVLTWAFEINAHPKGASVRLKSGAIVKGSRPTIYEICGDKRCPFPTADIYLANGHDWDDFVRISDKHLGTYDRGEPVEFNFTPRDDGTLITNPAETRYFIIRDGRKCRFLPISMLRANGHRFRDVVVVPKLEYQAYPVGPREKFNDRVVVKATTSAAVFMVEDGKLRVFPSGDVFLANGFEWTDIVTVTPDVLADYPIGEPMTEPGAGGPDEPHDPYIPPADPPDEPSDPIEDPTTVPISLP